GMYKRVDHQETVGSRQDDVLRAEGRLSALPCRWACHHGTLRRRGCMGIAAVVAAPTTLNAKRAALRE
ncbi:MAG: hypothetical protein QOI74_3157, partial [Micromonosporaceae bacterium]|nr:hypothetical protein [Micromonosporaceae bacterium]